MKTLLININYIMPKSLFLILFVVFIAGCSSNKPVSQNPETKYHEPVNYDSKRAIGVDLFASGNEPFWIVDMNSNDSTKIFILSDNSTVYFKTPKPLIDSDAKTIKYFFDTDITLTLTKGKCIDNMSGESGEFIATLNILNKPFVGCGKFIIATSNPFLSPSTLRLNDIWALRIFRDSTVNPSSFKEGIPVLELHLNDGRFFGNSNCNTISGSLTVEDSYITFSDITSSKKYCEGDFEAQYIQDLKSVDSWTLDKMVLRLKKSGKEVLVFKKID